MKRILLCLMLVGLVVLANAQEKNVKSFRLGLQISPNMGWIKLENVHSEGASVGFSYGLAGDFNFAENYSFSSGLFMTTINGNTNRPIQGLYAITSPNSPAGSNDWDWKYKIQYLEIPLAIKLKTSATGVVRGYGQFGLSNGFKMSAGMHDNQQDTDANASSYISLYRAGLLIGGGAEWTVGPTTSLFGGVIFNNGLTSISKPNSGSFRNHYVAVNLGVFF